MSLINDVLRDLDARRQRRNEDESSTLSGLRPAPRAPTDRLRTRGVFVVALGLAVAAALVAEAPRAPELPAVAAAPPIEPAAPSVAPRPEVEVEVEFLPVAAPPAKRRVRKPPPERPAAALATAAPPAPAPAPEPLCDSLVPGALEQAARGATVAARERLGDCLAADPRHRQAREALATLLARSGRAPEAIALLRVGRALFPGGHAFAHLEARIRVEQEDLEGALDLLEPQAGDPEADALRAALYQRQERHVEASQLYSTLVGRDASRPTWWMGLGLSLETLGHHERAVAAYRKAAGLGPLDGAARAWLGERIAALTQRG